MKIIIYTYICKRFRNLVVRVINRVIIVDRKGDRKLTIIMYGIEKQKILTINEALHNVNV